MQWDGFFSDFSLTAPTLLNLRKEWISQSILSILPYKPNDNLCPLICTLITWLPFFPEAVKQHKKPGVLKTPN